MGRMAATVSLLLLSCLAAAAEAPREFANGHFRASAPWLVENFRHAEPPRPTAPRAKDPLLERLDELHHATLSLLRYARLTENLWVAADALREARANLALAAELEARRRAPRPRR